MNFNNRLSSTLANNIKLDSNVEHEAEKIAGGNIIWLVNRPAGVKIYVNSTPDRTGALVLNESNRGYKWEELGEYGSLKLYDNFYIWTEGIDVYNEKIELQISPNADIITPILGNTADRIENIGIVNNIGDNAKKGIYESNKLLFSTKNLLYLDYVNASWEMPQELRENNNALIFITELADFGQLIFDEKKLYKITLEGHLDISTDTNTNATETGANQHSRSRQSIHLDLINPNAYANYTKMTQGTSNTATTIDRNQIQNLFKSPKNPSLETRDNHFTILGQKQNFLMYERLGKGQDDNRGYAYVIQSPASSNFRVEFFSPALYFKTMTKLICSYKNWMYMTWVDGAIFGFHIGLKIQLEQMDSLPDDPIINEKPYINPAFKK